MLSGVYIDDLTEAASVNLNKQSIAEPVQRTSLNFLLIDSLSPLVKESVTKNPGQTN